ncbi:MAG: hypothetical protein LBT59_03175 [Clostridiales bacterium]|nr:hypothetical protein [Clostridiales bacterium]
MAQQKIILCFGLGLTGSSKATIGACQNRKGVFTMIWAFLIVAVSLMFVLAILKMAFDHNERIERIKHGLPPKATHEEFDEQKRHFN